MTGLTELSIRDRMLSTVSQNRHVVDVDEHAVLVGDRDPARQAHIDSDDDACRRSIYGPLLAELLARLHATMAFVEHVGVRPGEGPVGAFAFGRCRGLVEDALAALSIPTSFIAAPSWKRAVGIAPGKAGAKDAARAEAIRRWPDKSSLFARVRDDGRAEAALIAVAGLMKQRTPR
jgi:crossover junction endodeoxyribonuclease RuvC